MNQPTLESTVTALLNELKDVYPMLSPTDNFRLWSAAAKCTRALEQREAIIDSQAWLMTVRSWTSEGKPGASWYYIRFFGWWLIVSRFGIRLAKR